MTEKQGQGDGGNRGRRERRDGEACLQGSRSSDVLQVAGKTLIEPQITPELHSDQVPKPLRDQNRQGLRCLTYL